MSNKTCEVCGKSFAGNAKKRFCSSVCRVKAGRIVTSDSGIVTKNARIVTKTDEIVTETEKIVSKKVVLGSYDEEFPYNPHCSDCDFTITTGIPNWFKLHLKGAVKNKEEAISYIQERVNREVKSAF